MKDYTYHPRFDPELDLLGEGPSLNEEGSVAADHTRKTAPVFTGEALQALGPSVMPQRALYGRLISQHSPNLPEKPAVPKVYFNTNAPFSAVICGVQGSGKSHSTSILLESCLMKDPRIGTLPEPLSALVFYFDTAAGGGLVQPCEAAYLSTLNPKLHNVDDCLPPPVTVLVVPSYLQAMKRVYAGLANVKVEPLLFAPGDISGERLLSMMKVDDNTQMPLYMESIMNILRSMQDNFDYPTFRFALMKQGFNRGQSSMLKLRLSLLDSFLEGGNETNSVTSHFKNGKLTIIDLSSPFMDGSSACGFFDMILGLFIETDIGTSGKMVVLDEAHKYLSDSQNGSSAKLTDSLLTVIRQQRHLATRVIISTQEPTVVPKKFLALCSAIIAHRFSSPTWLRELGEHVAAAQSSTEDLLSKIIALPTGQAIIFSPNALSVQRAEEDKWTSLSDDSSAGNGSIVPLGQGYFLVRSRLRITRDGGHSLLAVADAEYTTRLQRVSGRPVHDTSNATLPVVAPNATFEMAPSPRPQPLNPNLSTAPSPAAGSSVHATMTSPALGLQLGDDDDNWSTGSVEQIEALTEAPTASFLPVPLSVLQSPSIPTEAELVRRCGRFGQLVRYLLLQEVANNRRKWKRPDLCQGLILYSPSTFGTVPAVVDKLVSDAIDHGTLSQSTVTKKNTVTTKVTLVGHWIPQTSTHPTSISLQNYPHYAPLIRIMLTKPASTLSSILTLQTDLLREYAFHFEGGKLKLKKCKAYVHEAVQLGFIMYYLGLEQTGEVYLVPGATYSF